MQKNRHEDGDRRQPEASPTKLPAIGTMSLASSLQLLQELAAAYGAETSIDVPVRLHRTVSIDRGRSTPRCWTAIGAHPSAWTSLVPTLVRSCSRRAPRGAGALSGRSQCHREMEVAVEEGEQYGMALLAELNYPAGDSPYTPESTWEFAPSAQAKLRVALAGAGTVTQLTQAGPSTGPFFRGAGQ